MKLKMKFVKYENLEFEFLTVGELIKELSKFNKNLPVMITDGNEWTSYFGKFDFQIWNYGLNYPIVEIGVGGLNCDEEVLKQITNELYKQGKRNETKNESE